MKNLLGLVILVLMTITTTAQDLQESVAGYICNCIDTIENIDSFYGTLDSCINEAISVYNNDETDENEDAWFTPGVDSSDVLVGKILDNLFGYCPKLKGMILAEKQARYYRLSDSNEANEFYTSGIDAFSSEDYKTASKDYLKAIKADPKFVSALDNLGLTYRKMGNYKKAVKYYTKSLKVYPEGTFAIQNRAVAYTFMNKYEDALNDYISLARLYPDNPEGFFGIGKTYFLEGNYPDALDFAFKAHIMYSTQNSDYVADSQKLISLIYNEMVKNGTSDIFYQKAEKHGITINKKEEE